MSTPKIDFFLLRAFVRMAMLFFEVLKLKFISKKKYKIPINNNKFLIFTYSSDFKKSNNYYLSNYFRDLIDKFNEKKNILMLVLFIQKLIKCLEQPLYTNIFNSINTNLTTFFLRLMSI